ncbi:DUF2169 domain-containing protein [Xanthomonas cerealis pv. cerealis]|uniref:DUF2169 domain-containing protein n=1 Tax=Xanthomonas cerealis pv. cerealis TaxID=152263 RepID=A0A514EFL3_9XANT|nr:DUF2169 domain-containing protein [Xanthomonas translucens]QDI04829.1 DUF2169 domain-containing protein [Xanthomonas translucens pv. cerealis]
MHVEFRNLTPFDGLCFPTIDRDGRRNRVFVMKAGYRLRPRAGGQVSLQVIDDEPLPLCLADSYYGEPGTSSVCAESDLAPGKPRCDVVIVGSSYAPRGQPSPHWLARVRVSRPLPPVSPPEIPLPYGLAPNMLPSSAQLEQWRREVTRAEQAWSARTTHEALLDKTLRIHGPRHFKKAMFNRWQVSDAEPVIEAPLRWEEAWGGRSTVSSHSTIPGDSSYALDEVCFSNPLGRGWLEERQLKLASKDSPLSVADGMPAPRFEYPQAPISAPSIATHPEPPLDALTMAEIASGYGVTPAGFGWVGRSWAPRLARAGRYDEHWLESRWPQLPESFDAGYWNGAPDDQQIVFPPTDARIELWHLLPPDFSDREGLAVIDLPGHRPFVLLRLHNGVPLPLHLSIDTMVVDTQALVLALTCRVCISENVEVRTAELRFEVDPGAPLVRAAPIPVSLEET